jgi:class 3 adenylate cyclase
MSAMGGFRTFARTRSGDKVAPMAGRSPGRRRTAQLDQRLPMPSLQACGAGALVWRAFLAMLGGGEHIAAGTSGLQPGVPVVRQCATLLLVSVTGTRPDLGGKAAGGRKLIAVVYADMVGYSRLIGLDDAGTLQRLRSLRRTLIDPAIYLHGGTLVQTGGDSLLVAFDSIDGAVRFAVKVQQQVPVYDGEQIPDRQIRFRIGVNIGDVIADGTDLHGDGVNVAVRLQAECPVGHVCVSRAVQDHLGDRLGLRFEALGPLELKNIARPVEAFLLRVEATQDLAAISSVLPDLSLSKAPRLSIVVLPFQNLSGDQEHEYLADGITEDLTTDLSQLPGGFIIARSSAYTYKGQTVNGSVSARSWAYAMFCRAA